MKIKLELSSKKIKKLRRKILWQKKIYHFVLAGLLLTALIFVFLTSYMAILDQENKKLAQIVETNKEAIISMEPLEMKQIYLLSKLKSLSGVMMSHEKHQKIAETVFGLLPSGTAINGFEVDESGLIRIKGSVSHFLILGEMLERVKKKQDLPLLVLSSQMESVSFSENGIDFNLLIEVQTI